MKKLALFGMVVCALALLAATKLPIGAKRECLESGGACDARSMAEARALGIAGGVGFVTTIGAGMIWLADKD
jgi:hypothetical protein